MPRLRPVPRADAHPAVVTMYELLFGARDPVAEPGTATGTPGNWWTVVAGSPDVFRHCVAGFGLYLTAFAALHLVWWAVASGVPEQLETEYLKRHRPADYALQRLPRDRDAGPEELEALLRAGADVNRRTPDGRTPLFDAASNTPALALALLEAGADANQVSGAAGLPLHAAERKETWLASAPASSSANASSGALFAASNSTVRPSGVRRFTSAPARSSASSSSGPASRSRGSCWSAKSAGRWRFRYSVSSFSGTPLATAHHTRCSAAKAVR